MVHDQKELITVKLNVYGKKNNDTVNVLLSDTKDSGSPDHPNGNQNQYKK